MKTIPIARALLAAFFIIGGALHFVFMKKYMSVMPIWLGWHQQLVVVSGIFEILGGIGVLVPRVRFAAGLGLIALSIAVFPANVQMLINGLGEGRPAWQIALLMLRLPLQLVLIWGIWRLTRDKERVAPFA